MTNDNTRPRTATTTPGAEVNHAPGGDPVVLVDPATLRFQQSIQGYFDALHQGGVTTPTDGRPQGAPVTTDGRPQGSPNEVAVVTPRVRDGADNIGDRTRTATAADTAVDPSKQYRDAAIQAQVQLEAVLTKYRKPDGSPTGVPITEADRRTISEYQRTMTTNFERALVLSGGKTAEEVVARQQEIARQIDSFSSDISKEGLRQSLAQQYFNTTNVSSDQIRDKQRTATTQEDRDHLGQLLALETERERLQTALIAPALVRAQMGRAYLTGDLNPDVDGAVKHQVPFDQVNRGAKLVGDASQLDQSGAIRATEKFQELLRLAYAEVGQGLRLQQGTTGGGGRGDASTGVPAQPTDATRAGATVAGSQDSQVQQMNTLMTQAAQYEKDGKADLAMKAHEDANQIANTLSRSLIPQYMTDLTHQTDKNVQDKMVATIMLVERQRMDEAAYLQRRSQHQPDDFSRSLSLLNDARGEWGTLERLNPRHYGAQAGNEAWPSLSADPTFNQLLNKALTGGKTLDGDLSQTGVRIQQALDGKHYEALYQAVSDAQRVAGNWPTAEMKANVAQMQQHQTELQAQLAQTQADNTLSADAKAARIATIQGQIASAGQMAAFDQSKLNQKDQLVYLEGYANYLRGSEHYPEAFQKLNEFMQTDLYKNATPEQRKAWGLEDQVGPDGKPVHGLVWATNPDNQPNWWQRNMGWIAPVAGIVVGAAVGAATIWLGPGALVTGGAAATAVTAGLALGAGTVLGAGAYTGAKWSAGEQVNGSTFVDGLKWGALGASIVVAPHIASEAGLTFAAPEGAAGLARIAMSPMAQRAAFAAATSVPFASMQAVSDVNHGESARQTAINFGKTVGLSALAGGLPLGSAASTGRLWSPLSRTVAAGWATPQALAITVPVLQEGIPLTVQAGARQYVDVREYLHGGNDPNNPDDQVRMSQLAAQNPINLQLPDTTPRTDDPNQ